MAEPAHEVKVLDGDTSLLKQFQDATAKICSPEIWKFPFRLPGLGGFAGRGSRVCDVDGRGDEGDGGRLWAEGRNGRGARQLASAASKGRRWSRHRRALLIFLKSTRKTPDSKRYSVKW